MKPLVLTLLVIAQVIVAPDGRVQGQTVSTAANRAVPASAWDTYSDTWVATDALGRTLPGYDQVGLPRKDRFIGVFYFLWHGAHVQGGPYDISKILKQDPDAMQKPASPLWGPMFAPHHWGESLFGYYLAEDAYVLRKHAQMLADANVDVIIFDVTNELTYKSAYLALLKVFSEVRATGGKTPQVAFLCPFGTPEKVVKELYADLYEPGLFPDLWFRWEGKPLILADPALLAGGEGNAAQNTPSALLPGHSLGQSFIVKKPFDGVSGRFPTWATKNAGLLLTLFQEGPTGKQILRKRFENVADNAWLFLTSEMPLPPGNYYLEASESRGNIGWWSHTDNVFPDGQAFADQVPSPGDRTFRVSTVGERTEAIRRFFTYRKPQPDYFQGPTQPDMWSWLEVYPQHVFRNAKGEKEQMSIGAAQNAIGDRVGTLSEPGARGRNFHNGTNDPRPDAVLYGYNAAEQWEHALKEDPKFLFLTGWNEWFAARYDEFMGVKMPVMFVDTFNQINSRDIEPMQGGHGDNYYYQMISYIRRYKGVRQPPTASPPKTIHLNGDFRSWDSVQPEFRDDIGDASRRDHPGYNNVTRYVNTTGRNDFVLLKVARDTQYLYFYARTKDPITPSMDAHWMMLFLSIQGNPKTGWEGFDYVVNRKVVNATTTTLERSPGGWNWQRKAEIHYRVEGNELMLAIRRADLGLTDHKKPIQLEFKWADNFRTEGDINTFTLDGDSAPNGRFKYRYREAAH